MSFLLIFSVAVVQRPLYIFFAFLSLSSYTFDDDDDDDAAVAPVSMLHSWNRLFIRFFSALFSSSLHFLALLAHLTLSVLFFLSLPFLRYI